MAGSDGEWQHVRRRGRAARAAPRCAPQLPGPGDDGKPADGARARERLKETMAELTCEDLWRSWREVLSNRLLGGPRVPGAGEQEAPRDCVCYGLGAFLSSVSSRYQLAMLLLLLEALKIPPGHCSIFDPVFSAAECDALRSLGLAVLTENEEGKRPVSRPTLFYLPHCGTALYNNLLWSNWNPQGLGLLTIVGNSFQGLQERMVQKDFQRDYSFIAHVRDVCQETPLPCSSRFLDVFNDMALICFPSRRLAAVPPHIWARAPEPRYLHCSDLEIILRDEGAEGQRAG